MLVSPRVVLFAIIPETAKEHLTFEVFVTSSKNVVSAPCLAFEPEYDALPSAATVDEEKPSGVVLM